MTHCLRYESESMVNIDSGRWSSQVHRVVRSLPSMVGSYSSTKCDCINWIVKQDFPTPPPPTTTSLYSRRNYTHKRSQSQVKTYQPPSQTTCMKECIANLLVRSRRAWNEPWLHNGGRMGRTMYVRSPSKPSLRIFLKYKVDLIL